MLTLASYMDERSAKYKQEALGWVRVALAGSPPNCFYSLMMDLFGYPAGPDPQPSTLASTTAPAPSSSIPPVAPLLPTDPSLYKTIPDFGSGSEAPGPKGTRPALPSPYVSGAKAILPASDNRQWSCTSLASEYEPSIVNDLYKCPFESCDYQPRQNLDSVCTHVRCHLNVAIQCHYCSKIYWSSEGWLKHTREVHKDSKPVPVDYGKEKVAPLSQYSKGEHGSLQHRSRRGKGWFGSSPHSSSTDYDIEPEHTMEYQTTEDSDVQIVE